MDDKQLHTAAFDHALSLPGAQEHEFALGWTAVRVAGKWFMVATIKDDRQLINVKANPDDAVELTASFDFVALGYHMNKTHWVTITAGDDVTADFVAELITDSYALIIDKLPKAKRPTGSQVYLSRLQEG